MWDILGRGIRKRDAPVSTLPELNAVLHQEWQLVRQETIQKLMRSMRLMVLSVWTLHISKLGTMVLLNRAIDLISYICDWQLKFFRELMALITHVSYHYLQFYEICNNIE